MLNDLPAHITEDTEVLFVSPYHPDDVWEAQMSGGSEDDMIRAFQNAAERDPEFTNYRRAVFGLAEKLETSAWIIGDDLIIMEGDHDTLEAAKAQLEDKYDCHINDMADFLAHAFDPDFQDHLDIPAQDRKLN